MELEPIPTERSSTEQDHSYSRFTSAQTLEQQNSYDKSSFARRYHKVLKPK